MLAPHLAGRLDIESPTKAYKLLALQAVKRIRVQEDVLLCGHTGPVVDGARVRKVNEMVVDESCGGACKSTNWDISQLGVLHQHP